MKTRAQIYSHEASGILRDISTYGVLTQKQIFGLYPQKDEQIKNLLSYLCKQKRLFLVDGFYSLTPELYGRFLCGVFDVWYQQLQQGNYVSVRNFEDYLRILLGMPPTSCASSGSCGWSMGPTTTDRDDAGSMGSTAASPADCPTDWADLDSDALPPAAKVLV